MTIITSFKDATGGISPCSTALFRAVLHDTADGLACFVNFMQNTVLLPFFRRTRNMTGNAGEIDGVRGVHARHMAAELPVKIRQTGMVPGNFPRVGEKAVHALVD